MGYVELVVCGTNHRIDIKVHTYCRKYFKKITYLYFHQSSLNQFCYNKFGTYNPLALLLPCNVFASVPNVLVG
jgi:hypothetical protein